MNCPACKTVTLVMSERQGIEIDYCPQCRGVWLDRGELDKIIERSAAVPAGAPQAAAPQPVQAVPSQHTGAPRPSGAHHHDSHHGGYYKKRKREGFLSDLFDFD